MKALFIGGSGVISSACVRRAADDGFDVTVLNRGRSTTRPLPAGVRELRADVRDLPAVRDALAEETFDVVADFLAFTPAHVRAAVETFAGRTGQYVFISSASAYQTPPARLPITESTPLRNPFWGYSRNKIAAEDVLVGEYREDGFPATIVRPSHTYDATMVPLPGGWTTVERMRRGAEVVVPGDGTSLWVLTHNSDFAAGFTGLLGATSAIGEAFHITSHEVLTWNQIYTLMAEAAGVEPRLVHVASEAIAAADPELGASLLGDKAHSVIFDNAKVRRLVPDFSAKVPFARGAREIVDWYDADPARRAVDEDTDRLLDALVAAYRPRSL
ncbi:SDR family oxidoreductase [Georgenia muralis]|uniref:Nucleoside-diphosphate-sugar epimerase n=1 Tax=Georgenia muralis TaxID=154117 RepID=A0A3N4Z9S8_9MICO|nr:SDR family oxidoreductase [Georgenia muralis]RPF28863.1 nucleoside-diphosphate-sugar epimerase [Georgenia muralis]